MALPETNPALCCFPPCQAAQPLGEVRPDISHQVPDMRPPSSNENGLAMHSLRLTPACARRSTYQVRFLGYQICFVMLSSSRMAACSD